MGTMGIVNAVDVLSQRGARLEDAAIGPQIDLLVFDGSPQALDEHIVPPLSWLRRKRAIRALKLRRTRPIFTCNGTGRPKTGRVRHRAHRPG